MQFKFAQYTEVTDLGFQVNPDYEKSGYTRLFLCPDVNDTQLIRVLPGFGEDYERDDESIIVEHQMIPNRFKGQKVTPQRAASILKVDDFSNWDYEVFPNDIDSIIKTLDYGSGIINLKSSSLTPSE